MEQKVNLTPTPVRKYACCLQKRYESGLSTELLYSCDCTLIALPP